MDDFLRHQIRSAHDQRQRNAVTARVAGQCWPGGVSDRSEPAALAWLKQWRPERIGVRIPACSCRTGRCALCN